MDSRMERTERLLRAAVFELAGEKPISDVTVAELSRAAEISRNTFYRWAESPKALLVRFLTAELDDIIAVNAHLPASSGSSASVFEGLARDIFQSVRQHASIYRQALGDGLLWNILTTYVEQSLLERIAEHPEIRPIIRGLPASDTAVAMSIRYASVGAVGAIETWLLQGDLDDIDLAVEMLLSTSPPWWQGRTSEGT